MGSLPRARLAYLFEMLGVRFPFGMICFATKIGLLDWSPASGRRTDGRTVRC